MENRLNIFQRTVLVWNDMHPYNAVHIVKIQQPLNLPELETMINSYLEDNQLTGLEIDRRRNRYYYHGGAANLKITALEKAEGTTETLIREVRDQLNQPFNQGGKMTPFRFFVIDQEDSFYLGLVYFHLVAGADSIILLLKDLVNLYLKKSSDRGRELERYPGTYRQLMPFRFHDLIGWLRTFPGQITRMRSSFRPRYADYADTENGFHFLSLQASEFFSLKKTAALWKVTINDLFLALLLMAISPLAEKRRQSRRRKNISVASIANIRKDLSVDRSRTFSIFLGYFSVSHHVPEEKTVEKLAKEINVQTGEIKKYRVYLRSILEQYLALPLLSLFSGQRQLKFYPKYYPLWAGLTNVNLKTIWDGKGDDGPADYIRAVSTGPVCPLVVSFTTVNEILNIGISYRTAVYSAEDIEFITGNFSKYIETMVTALK